MAEMHAELRFCFLFGRKLSGGTSLSATAIAGGHNASLALRNTTVLAGASRWCAGVPFPTADPERAPTCPHQ